ncbi:MAG: Fic family protein [Armatimonadota bacterium]
MNENLPTRAGVEVSQLSGDLLYKAFTPKPLPPEPPLVFDEELLDLLSNADRALGRLDGIAETLPDPDLFVAMYVRKEAVLSSQIEGTQSSLVDLLEYESDKAAKGIPGDVEEVVNYVHAMNYGLDRLAELPISLRLIREVHEKLLEGARGSERRPGEFRTTQNWIGPAGCTLADASFVPPPPHEVVPALGSLENYIHDESPMPVLVKTGLVHAQFETIHPFLDGNGRVGRLLITLLLCERGILSKPLLYISYYFKRNRAEYYDRLSGIRTRGDWESWLKFFLKGVYEVSIQATETSRNVLRLREEHRRLVQERVPGVVNGLALLDALYASPIVTVKLAANLLGVSKAAANTIVARFCEAGILQQIGEGSRNRSFSYSEYLSIFDR